MVNSHQQSHGPNLVFVLVEDVISGLTSLIREMKNFVFQVVMLTLGIKTIIRKVPTAWTPFDDPNGIC